MRCRRLKKTNDGHFEVVWFGSYGVNSDGSSKLYNVTNKHDNYSTEKEAVKDSLTQRLSCMKKELWYDINYGLPLIDKVKEKSLLDSWIYSQIMNHPDVYDIETFQSSVNQSLHQYSCYISILTKYGKVEINV